MPMLHKGVVHCSHRSPCFSDRKTRLSAWKRTAQRRITPLAACVALVVASPLWGQETIDGAPQQDRSANAFTEAVYQQWWFDIELIVFTRETAIDNASEQFPALDLSAPSDFKPRLAYEFDPITLWALQTQTQPVAQRVRQFQWCSTAQVLDVRLSTLGLNPTIHESIGAAARGLFQATLMNTQPLEVSVDLQRPYCHQAELGAVKPLLNEPVTDHNQTPFDSITQWQTLSAAQLLNLPLKPSLGGTNSQRVATPENQITTASTKPSAEQFQLRLLPPSEYRHEQVVAGLEKTPDTRPVLHIAWRQEIKFSREANPYWRIHGGYRYPLPFQSQHVSTQSLKPLTEHSHTNKTDAPRSYNKAAQEQVIERILATLTDDESSSTTTALDADHGLTQESLRIQEIVAKQLEGRLKVYLEYVDRVPYLHVDSQLRRLKPVVTGDGEEQWLQIDFNQRRRVVSSQLHYFDHPHLGVLIEIRRFSIPTF